MPDECSKTYWSGVADLAEADGVPVYAQWARLFHASEDLRQLAGCLPRTTSPAPAIFAALRLINDRYQVPGFPALDRLDPSGPSGLDDAGMSAVLNELVRVSGNSLRTTLQAWLWHAPDTDYLRALAGMMDQIAARYQPGSYLEVGACAGLGLVADRLHGRRRETSRRAGCDLHPLRLDHPRDRKIAQYLTWPQGREALQLLERATAMVRKQSIRIERSEGFSWLRRTHPKARQPAVWMALFVFSNYLPDEIEPATDLFLRRARARGTLALLGTPAPGGRDIGRLSLYSPSGEVDAQIHFLRGKGDVLD